MAAGGKKNFLFLLNCVICFSEHYCDKVQERFERKEPMNSCGAINRLQDSAIPENRKTF